METIFESKPVRIEKMFWLPTCAIDQEALPEELQEFLESDLPERKSGPLYKELPELKEFAGEGDLEVWDVCYAIRARKGFLFQIAAPVITPSFGKSFSYSWGYTHIGWLYADTLDGVKEATAKQVEAWHTSDRKEHAASKKSATSLPGPQPQAPQGAPL